MAVTAKFVADFDSFFDAVQKADVELKGMETGASNVEKSLTRVANSFSGQKIIQDANLVAAAIDKIGGVSTLTENEQGRVNAKITEAIEKYNALGLEAPKNLQAIADATKKNEDETSNFGDLVGRITERFAIYEVLRGALDFSKEILASASAIEDLSRATGIGTDSLQELSYVGTSFGLTTEDMGRAVEQLSAKLAGGDKTATSAVQSLGLSINQLLAEGPKDAFLDVAEAVGKVNDPMDKAAVAAELFGGRLGRTLLPALGDLRTQMNAVPKDAVISEATIKSAHDFEVGLEHLETRLKSWTATAIKAVHDGWLVIGDAITNQRTLLPEEAAMVDEVTESLKKQAAAAGSGGDGIDRLQEHLNSLRTTALAPLTDEQKKYLDAALAANESTADSAKWLKISEAAVKSYEDAQKTAAETVKKHAEAVQKLADELGGKALAQKVTDLDEAFRKLSSSGPLTTTQLQKFADAAADLLKKGGDLSPQMTNLAVQFNGLLPVVKDSATAFGELGIKITTLALPAEQSLIDISDKLSDRLKLGAESLGILGLKVSDGFKEGAKAIDEYNKQTTTAINELSQAFGAFGTTAGGVLGNIISLAGKMSHDVVSALKDFKSASSAFGDGNTLAGILSMSSGILGIASAAISAGKAIAGFIGNLFGLGSAGRDAVVAFANSMGGFDALHVQLNALGQEGERLWINLTQGVGKNNPQQAQAAIQAVIDALNKQKTAQDNAGAATEEQAAATIETATQASEALKTLGTDLQSNEDEWKTWSDLVNGYINGVASTILTMPLPSPSGFSSVGGTPGYTTGSSGVIQIPRGPKVSLPDSSGNSLSATSLLPVTIQVGQRAMMQAMVEVAHATGAR